MFFVVDVNRCAFLHYPNQDEQHLAPDTAHLVETDLGFQATPLQIPTMSLAKQRHDMTKGTLSPKRGSVLKRVALNVVEGNDGSDEEFVSHDDNATRLGRSMYWEGLWSAGVQAGTLFDNGGPCRALEAILQESSPLVMQTALVPGCGRGYDCATLAKAGFQSVIGVELSATAARVAETWIATQEHKISNAVEIVQANFFELGYGNIDLVFDCTFLCALHPAVHRAWAAKMNDLIKPGGSLVSLVFPIVNSVGARFVQFVRYYVAGPPYSLSVGAVKQLLEPYGFKLQQVQDPLPPHLQHLASNSLGAESAIAIFKKPDLGDNKCVPERDIEAADPR